MKKKIAILLIIMIILFIIGVILFDKKDYSSNENTLYSIKFDNIRLRIQRYDYVLGQNQLVGVEKSFDDGKTYEKITEELITVSMKPKVIFLNEKVGFIIAKPQLNISNGFSGVKVTQDGGKTFVDAKINYFTANIDTIKIEDVPYQEKELLKLPCSIYQVKEDKSGYEDVKILFESSDNGLTWNIIKDNPYAVTLSLKKGTISNKGATFIIKNNMDKEYWYGEDYIIKQKINGNWVEVKTISGEPLTWNDIAYTLKANEEKVINVNWSFGYGELKSGDYVLIKTTFKEEDRPIDESKKVFLYAEFSIR